MKLGVVLNYNDAAGELFKWCTENEITTCQLSVDPERQTLYTAKTIMELCEKHGMVITALVGTWTGPNEWNFKSGPSTLGIVPPAFRAMRIKELESCARFAQMMGIKDICTHLGFIPENPCDPLYPDFIASLRYLLGYYKDRGIRLNMETGQETPVTLLRVINDVQADNIGINFDPANLLMYGKANPIDALSILSKYVYGVHAKDGEYPKDGISLGEEKPLGSGRVNIPLFIQKLHEIGYNGAVTIEREISGRQQKHDIIIAAQLIKSIIKELTSEVSLSRHPDNYNLILDQRPDGPRRIWTSFDERRYNDRLAGALYGRMAGCTLGAPVECWDVDRMEEWANHIGDVFPPVDYWTAVPEPHKVRYDLSPCSAYTRDGMNGVPVDDDIIYTLLGLLIAEDYGLDFTTANVGGAWLKYLPLAATAEAIALEALKKGVSADKAAEGNNPYIHWIGAGIRADPFAYMAPGHPERAACMAYRDAYLSHRQNGIYGEMFFAASIAAAFAVDNAVDALKIGLTEIPRDCDLARDVTWALSAGKDIHDYKAARAAIDERFPGMSMIHTNNNACLTVFGLMIGNGDFTKTISETVAMGLDNDCTAATAGSLAGAISGQAGIPEHWTKPFNNIIHTYFYGNPDFAIDDVLYRFMSRAKKHF